MFGVSVIIPVYNAERYLRRCLDSVCEQTFGDIEIICVDDGSTDASVDILREYKEKDTRFKIITQSNKGAGEARNTGLNSAEGKYLYFLDSDDEIKPRALEVAFNEAEKSRADIVIFNFETYDDENDVISDCYYFCVRQLRMLNGYFTYKDFPDNILEFGRMVWNKLFKREFINANKIRFQNTLKLNDVYFSSVSFICAEKMTYIDDILIRYYIMNEKSITHINKFKPTPIEVFCGIKQCLSQKGLYGFLKRSFVNFSVSHILQDLRNMGADLEAGFIIAKENLRTLELASLVKDDFISNDLFDHYSLLFNSGNPHEYSNNCVFLLNKQMSAAYDSFNSYNKSCDELNKWCAELTKWHDESEALQVKNNLIMDWLNSLLIVKKQGKSIEQYLKRLNFYNIAVYGYGKIGQRLIDELTDGSSNILYLIDQAELETELPVYKPTDDLPPADVIIVTAIYDFDDIENMLFDKVSCPIVSAGTMIEAFM